MYNKIAISSKGVAVAASVFTITAMSVDRYLAVRSPMDLHRMFNRKTTIMTIITLWFIALTIFAPLLKAVRHQAQNLNNSNKYSLYLIFI